MSKAIFNFYLWQAAFFTISAATACYYPDGSRVADPAYQPCNPAPGAQSMCCGTNHTQPTLDDTCLPNGLCQTLGATADNMFWRESCTDPTWDSPSCLKGFCVSGVGVSGNIGLTLCSDGTWCCGSTSTTCCTDKQGISLAATVGGATSISVSSSITAISVSSTITATSMTSAPPTITSVTTPPSDSNATIHLPSPTSISSLKAILTPASTLTTPPATTLITATSTEPTESTLTTSTTPSTGALSLSTTPLPTPTPSHGLTSQAKIGIGVGVPLGFIAAVGLIICLRLRRREHSPSSAPRSRRPKAPRPRFSALGVYEDEGRGQSIEENGSSFRPSIDERSARRMSGREEMRGGELK
ncbi:MAG: hypothetical protein FRX48_04306 [Lasallia pustulata]|uniref:Mid2 domain-containing protein n=1 Tax=Lasallia pustulata TaxID=136370 RepID=A0A1W5D6B2_9LECA|nr:MAG: hypothetical protein FRX48_04306 [Lasallia pustulata]SLM38571.1 hypothetical protein LPUS_00997 [Lasallia pustulata]